MSPKIVDKKQRREKIAWAAFELFSQHGFENTTVEAVAKHVGVSKGSVYDYFKTKDDLIAASFTTWMNSLEEELGSTCEQDVSPEKQIRDYFETMIDMFLGDDSMIRMTTNLLNLMMDKKRGPLFKSKISRKLLSGPRNKLVHFILDGVSQGHFKPELAVNAEKIAMNLLAYGDGIVLYYWLSDRSFDLRQHFYFYLNRLIDDLRL